MIKPAIVIVDAFPQVLHQLKNDLEQKYSDRFRIIEAASGQQALNQLEQMSLRNEPVALLLADEQMPEMNGSQFLKEARDLYPQAKRILLTTYADTHAAIQAINTALIDYYLMKPWDPPEERLYPVLDDVDALTVNLSSWRPASPVSSPPEMCGRAPSSGSPPASARGQWPFSSSIDTWASYDLPSSTARPGAT